MHKSQAPNIRVAKAFVTGGAGFIGSHICEELTKDYEVYSHHGGSPHSSPAPVSVYPVTLKH